ncbi:MAG: YecA family protein [Rubrivivax sp.]
MNRTSGPLTEADIGALQGLLDAVPAPLEPLDVSALDGYLCGVLLQPRAVPAEQWLPGVTDVDGRALPAGYDPAPLHALVRRRHAELEQAIARRDWFDPWIFEFDAEAGVSEQVLPWVAGFAAAQERFPALQAIDDPALVEPLALLYLHVDREDLEDADALLEVIDTLEPPADLAEAVQDLVRALMLIADVTRPRAPAPGAAARRRTPRRR